MSLIEEALRRVKDPLVPPSTTAKTPRKGSSAKAPATAHSWSTTSAPASSQPVSTAPAVPLAMVTIAILGLTVTLIFGGALWMWRTLNGKTRIESARGTVQDTTTPRERSAPAPSANATAEFSLTGIVEGLGDPYAVINGSIVAKGETIGKATLLDIGKGTVTLRLADGKETVLRVSR